MNDQQKLDILRRHLFENRDREISTTQIMDETGINRKAALELLPLLYKMNLVDFNDCRGKTLWRWRARQAGPLEQFMQHAKNRRGNRWMQSCSPASLTSSS